MNFSLHWTEHALREMDNIARPLARHIIGKVELLQDSSHHHGIKKMHAEDAYRLRVGDYRIIFSISKSDIYILKVGHRQHIYEKGQ